MSDTVYNLRNRTLKKDKVGIPYLKYKDSMSRLKRYYDQEMSEELKNECFTGDKVDATVSKEEEKPTTPLLKKEEEEGQEKDAKDDAKELKVKIVHDVKTQTLIFCMILVQLLAMLQYTDPEGRYCIAGWATREG